MSEEEPESSLAINAVINAVIDNVAKAFESVANVVADVARQIMPAIQQIYTAMEEKYQEAGAPYGDSHEGLMKWMNDMGEVNRKQQEIERILMYHETLVDARRLGEKIRARQQGLDKNEE